MFFSTKPPAQPPKKNSGADAEQRAEHFLQQQGLVTKNKNYRCKLGEIDLIMTDGTTLIFIEVRLRNHHQFASAIESITLSKQQKIIRTAHYYLQEHRLTDKIACRFDVIALSNHRDPEWIKNAFSA